MKRSLAIVLMFMLMGLVVGCDKGNDGGGGGETSAVNDATGYSLEGRWRIEVKMQPWVCTSGTFQNPILVGVIQFDKKNGIVGIPTFNLRLPWRNFPNWPTGFDSTKWRWISFSFARDGVYRWMEFGIAAATNNYPPGQPSETYRIGLGMIIRKLKFINPDQLTGFIEIGQGAVLGDPEKAVCIRESAESAITLYRR